MRKGTRQIKECPLKWVNWLNAIKLDKRLCVVIEIIKWKSKTDVAKIEWKKYTTKEGSNEVIKQKMSE